MQARAPTIVEDRRAALVGVVGTPDNGKGEGGLLLSGRQRESGCVGERSLYFHVAGIEVARVFVAEREGGEGRERGLEQVGDKALTMINEPLVMTRKANADLRLRTPVRVFVHGCAACASPYPLLPREVMGTIAGEHFS